MLAVSPAGGSGLRVMIKSIIESNARLPPLLTLMTSFILSTLKPALTPSTNASIVATILIPLSRLFTSFIVAPVPVAPT